MSGDALRKHLVELLHGGQAHLTFREALDGFPAGQAGVRPKGSPHSAWELLEHIRIALHDIVLFSGLLEKPPGKSRSRTLPKGYVELKWPADYWPKSQSPENDEEWRRSVIAIEQDLSALVRLIEDSGRDLFEPFPWGEGQTLLREALLIADHTAYHLGQLVLVRRMLEQKSRQG